MSDDELLPIDWRGAYFAEKARAERLDEELVELESRYHEACGELGVLYEANEGLGRRVVELERELRAANVDWAEVSRGLAEAWWGISPRQEPAGDADSAEGGPDYPASLSEPTRPLSAAVARAAEEASE